MLHGLYTCTPVSWPVFSAVVAGLLIQLGREVGMLKVQIVPHITDAPPSRVTDDDDLVEPLENMMGRSMFLTVRVVVSADLKVHRYCCCLQWVYDLVAWMHRVFLIWYRRPGWCLHLNRSHKVQAILGN